MKYLRNIIINETSKKGCGKDITNMHTTQFYVHKVPVNTGLTTTKKSAHALGSSRDSLVHLLVSKGLLRDLLLYLQARETM